MMTRWDTVPLDTKVSFLSGGTPRKSEERYWGGTIPWVSSGEMTKSRIGDTEHLVTDEGAENGTKLVPAHTVMVVVRGMSLAKEFRISISTREVTFNQDVKAIVPSKDIDPWFLFYYLKSQRHQIRESATDASHGTKKLDMHVLKDWPFPLVSPSEQESIVSVLSAYDDLIENNRRRIQLLEESARLLYQEWFVRLRFPGHAHVRIVNGVPEGWNKKRLGEVAPLSYGKALKKDLRIPGQYPVYGSSGEVGSHNKFLVKGPGIILGRKGNVGSVFWSSKDFFPIDTVYFLPNDKATLYLYYVLMHMSFINTDVAVPGLNRDFAHSREMLIPDDMILMLFNDYMASIHDQIDCLTAYNKSLADTRDLLLPRLMNGEVGI